MTVDGNKSNRAALRCGYFVAPPVVRTHGRGRTRGPGRVLIPGSVVHTARGSGSHCARVLLGLARAGSGTAQGVMYRVDLAGLISPGVGRRMRSGSANTHGCIGQESERGDCRSRGGG